MSRLAKIVTPAFERIVFYLLLTAAVANVWWQPYFITLDGVAHVYNASLLRAYDNSSFLQSYLEHNHAFLPNYLSHWMLKLLLSVADFQVAEKLLVTLIAIGLPLSFRWLVQVLSKDVPYYSFLVFPLVFTNLLHFGFYNYSLGFIFFNFHLILLLKACETGRALWWLLMFCNSLLLYYCHLFGYAVGAIAGIILLFTLSREGGLAKRSALYILIHLPTIAAGILFAIKTTVPEYDYDLGTLEKATSIATFTTGIAYEKNSEIPYSMFFTALLTLLAGYIIASRQGWRRSDLFGVLAILTIYLIFHTKDGEAGGMLIHRLINLAFYLTALWVASNASRGAFTVVACAFVIFIFTKLVVFQSRYRSGFVDEIDDVVAARPFIRERSTIHSVAIKDHWLHSHISNYLGIGKEAVVLENYEAALGWFPFSWKPAVRPAVKDRIHIPWTMKPDYIFIYCFDKPVNCEKPDSLQSFLGSDMKRVYASPDGFCELYEKASHR